MTTPDDRPYTPEETLLIRQRQAARSKILAVLLVGMCLLFFGITVAKIGYW
jgi:hypothetical protein